MTAPHPDIHRTLLFLRGGDEILLAMKKRGFGAGKWNGVGGKLEPGETIEQALIRETREEIGVIALRYSKVAELDTSKENDEGRRMHVHTFLADSWSGEPVESEEMAPRWHKLHNIPYDEMWENDRYWPPQALEGKKIIAEFAFDEQERLVSHNISVVEHFAED